MGKAGWVLDVAMKGAGVERSEVRITNVVKCMPYVGRNRNKFRKPTRREMQHCASRYLASEVEELRSKGANAFVALGAVALEWFSKGTLRGDVTAWRGKVIDVG